MANSKIEWTDKTWNPVVGCQKISSGCQNCYAERMAKRLRAMGVPKYHDVVNDNKWTGLATPDHEEVHAPQFWRKPCRVFVCSMGDLFHNYVSDRFIEAVFCTMELTPRHTYFILTKRPERMMEFVNHPTGKHLTRDNVWMGVSVEDQATANDRIPLLLRTPAEHRFVSYEPALGAIDLTHIKHDDYGSITAIPMQPHGGPESERNSITLDWIIAGCESGPHRRPADINWFRSVRDQCQAAGTPFFLKQMEVDGKLVKMPKLDDRVWDQT